LPQTKLQATSNISLLASLGVWLKIGLISFGGPAAQISLLHQELVEKRRWISDRRFLHALNYCMVLPGPEAQQLATYLGWLTHGVLGGILAGVLFIAPSLVIMLGLGYLYVMFGQLPEAQALLYGIKPAVLAIVFAACLRIGQRVLHGPFWWAIAAGAFLGLVVGLPFVLIIALAGFIGWSAFLLSKTPVQGLDQHGAFSTKTASKQAIKIAYVIDDNTPTPPMKKDSRHLAMAIGTGVAMWALLYSATNQFFPGVIADMALFFTKVALITFGGAYAVLPYVFDSSVNHYQWVSAGQMMDALAFGETTPGPLVMVNAFVGYLGAAQDISLSHLPIAWAGALGAFVVTVFTFLPSFMFILVGAPWIEATRKRPSFAAPLTAVTAAVAGVIVHLALVFAQHTFFPDGRIWSWRSLDLVAIFITVIATLMLLQFRKGMAATLFVSIALGIVASILQLY
jgi:chromate transporter